MLPMFITPNRNRPTESSVVFDRLMLVQVGSGNKFVALAC